MIGLKYRDSLTEFPSRQAFGLPELFWAIRYWLWKRKSRGWDSVTGKFAGREFLMLFTNVGWFSLSYTYEFGGQVRSGELRKWMRAKRRTSLSKMATDSIQFSKRFPDDLQIRLRVNPRQPDSSVVGFPV